MIDLGLIAAARKAVASKPRRFVTPAHVVAVAMQESHGVPTFTPWEAQYRANLRAAINITKMNEGEIRKLIIIPVAVNGWKVPTMLVNKFAKFRCEPGYWKRFRDLPAADRFYMSCSWGLGQLMGAHLPDANAVRRFLADVPQQVLWVAGMMDQLLISSHGDLKRAYAGYNSGDIDCQDRAVLHRCDEVEKYFEQAEKQIQSFNHSSFGG